MATWPGLGGRGWSWPLPEGLDDAQLETLLYPPRRRWRRNSGRFRTGRWCTASCGGRT